MFKAEWASQKEWTCGDVRFEFHEIPGMLAWRILEEMREALGAVFVDTAESKVVDGEVLMDPLLIPKTVMAMPRAYVSKLRRQMFKHVYFEVPNNTPQQLLGGEDTAFDRSREGITPFTVYLVFARSLAVNFMSSFTEMSKELGSKEG